MKVDGALGGWQPDRPAFALEIGSGFHKGMEWLLRAVIDGRVQKGEPAFFQFSSRTIDHAVAAGIKEYESNILPYFNHVEAGKRTTADGHEDIFTDDGGEFGEDSFNHYSVNEGRALVEALIRVYCAAPAGLAALLDEYEILEVEQEIDAPLDPCQKCQGTGKGFDYDVINPEAAPVHVVTMNGRVCADCNGSGGSVILMSRPDGILRSRKDGQLYVLSFKTTGKWDSRKANSARYDTQGMSELIAAEHKYNEKFAGVQMVYIIKGYKMQDKLDNIWKVHNGVIRPYCQRGVTGDYDAYAFGYEYSNEFGEVKRLGKGWQKINLWEERPGAIKDWVDVLATGQFPEELNNNVDRLDQMVIMQPPFYRDEEAIEEWKLEAVLQEMRIAEFRPDGIFDLSADAMALVFPKHRHSCSYPLPCPFIPVCHDGMPVDAGGFKPRTKPNHPQEMKEGEDA